MNFGKRKSEMDNCTRSISFLGWMRDTAKTPQARAPSVAFNGEGLDLRRRSYQGADQIIA